MLRLLIIPVPIAVHAHSHAVREAFIGVVVPILFPPEVILLKTNVQVLMMSRKV